MVEEGAEKKKGIGGRIGCGGVDVAAVRLVEEQRGEGSDWKPTGDEIGCGE
jgi:hypothetical protein